jgi:Ca-activated chloride channel family protein
MLRLSTLLVLLAATLCSAQDLGDHDYSVSVNVELVQLSVSVQDKKGFPVRDLHKEHFAVYEDKVQQDISLFKQEDIPLSVALVVDTSGSMADKLASINTAAMTFVKESNPDDETAVVTFSSIPRIHQDFTQDTNELRGSLGGIFPNGNTALYDAVLLASRHLKRAGFHDKKVLLIISDGQDNESKNKLKDVLEAIQESKIIVYSIGLLGSDSGNSNYDMFTDEAKNALKRLAETTGGAAFFPNGSHQVKQVCERIARDLRNQYTIGYKPSNEKLDGSWRKTIVKVNPPKTVHSVKVRTKQGYYAPVAKPASVASATPVK